MKAFTVAIGVLIASASPCVLAGISQVAWDFEQTNSNNNGAWGWFFTGGAGLDNGMGLERRGSGNAWVRNTTGWNAINNWVRIQPGRACTASAWLRTSETLTDGYMSVRNDDWDGGDGAILNEVKLVGARPSGDPGDRGYQFISFDFDSRSNSRVLFYVGLWGVGRDAWIQIDDAAITCRF